LKISLFDASDEDSRLKKHSGSEAKHVYRWC